MTGFDSIKQQVVGVLEFESNVLEGRRKPSVESRMQVGIYQSRPDVCAVVHTHQAYPSALTLIGRPIPEDVRELMFAQLQEAQLELEKEDGHA